MNKNRRNKEIASLILRAQNASDGGKGIHAFPEARKARHDNAAGYPAKDKFIILALQMIAQGGSNFKFSVQKFKEDWDEEEVYYIVYFETKILGIKYQVSFHNFSEELEKYVKRSFRLKWDHGISRDSAETIYNYYNQHGFYSA
jgi:hypothetical protein